MAHQKVMSGGTHTESQPNGFLEGIGTFGTDLITLAVLQARLAACELREGLKAARLGLVLLLFCVLVSASGLIAIVLGVALWMATVLQIQQGPAFLLVGLACMIAAALIGWLSVRALTPRIPVFQRSTEELERNLAWIKTTLLYSGR
jgi:hypothetical protein